jgi:inorganic pyrophosphatase
MDIAKIAAGRAPPHDFNVVVEIPQGGEPVKYEIDKETGALFVDRFLNTAMSYPGNYGFVPHTLALDGARSTC